MIQRGDIWWAELPDPLGSEPGYRRPVVIVQADTFNDSRLGTVLAVGLTTNLQRADAPGNVLLPSRRTGLPRDCVANVSQVITVDKRFLSEQVGPLPALLLHRIDEGLRLILDL